MQLMLSFQFVLLGFNDFCLNGELECASSYRCKLGVGLYPHVSVDWP